MTILRYSPTSSCCRVVDETRLEMMVWVTSQDFERTAIVSTQSATCGTNASTTWISGFWFTMIMDDQAQAYMYIHPHLFHIVLMQQGHPQLKMRDKQLFQSSPRQKDKK
mmetsp:Transcript_5677/g.16814  ORF Transcript_5677/g.16814 Transcript_5677/m.16814 type:complete len:109 (+) Transcript_5677:515-841(+)